MHTNMDDGTEPLITSIHQGTLPSKSLAEGMCLPVEDHRLQACHWQHAAKGTLHETRIWQLIPPQKLGACSRLPCASVCLGSAQQKSLCLDIGVSCNVQVLCNELDLSWPSHSDIHHLMLRFQAHHCVALIHTANLNTCLGAISKLGHLQGLYIGLDGP